jgi:hypothetical protein
MKLSDPLLTEVFRNWPAWQVLVENVTEGVDASVIDPRRVAAACEDLSLDGWMRLSHLMVGHGHADTLDEAVDLLTDLRALAIEGKRPRYGAEAGLTMEAFEAVRPHAA